MVGKKSLTIILFLEFLLMFCSSSKESSDVKWEVKDSVDVTSDFKSEKQEQKGTEINETFDEVETKFMDEKEEPDTLDVEVEESDAFDMPETVEVNTNFEVPECKHIPEGKKVCKKWRSSWVKEKIFQLNYYIPTSITQYFFTGFKAKIDDKGFIHLVYFEGLPNNTEKMQIMYVTNLSGEWKSSVVDGVFSVGLFECNSVFDFSLEPKKPIPHIAYTTPTGGGCAVHAYMKDDGTWIKECLNKDSTNYDIFAISTCGKGMFCDSVTIRLNGTGEVYTYYPGLFESIFAKKSGNSWSITKFNFDSSVPPIVEGEAPVESFGHLNIDLATSIMSGSFFIRKDNTISGIYGSFFGIYPPVYYYSVDTELKNFKACYVENKDKFSEDYQKIIDQQLDTSNSNSKFRTFPVTGESCSPVQLSDERIVSLCVIQTGSGVPPIVADRHAYFLYTQTKLEGCNFTRKDITNEVDSQVLPLMPPFPCEPDTKGKYYGFFKANGAVDGCDRVFFAFQFEKYMYKNEYCEQLDPNVLAFVAIEGDEVKVSVAPEIKAISYNTNFMIDKDQNLHLIYIEPPDDPTDIFTPKKLNIIHAVKECEEYY